MRIIEQGNPPPKSPLIGKCERCNSVCEAEQNELDMTFSTVESLCYGTAKCPLCGHMITFRYKKNSD